MYWEVEMKYPKNLTKLGTVGFAAPSFGCNTEPYKSRMEHAVERMKQWGHPVMLGPNCFLGGGIGISNTPELCAKELTELYCSRENSVLLSCAGGELMNETIEHMDWRRIREAKPKWFMGYSDNTNFTFLLTTLCDTAAVYGPNATSFGMEPLHPSLRDAYELLCGEITSVHNYEAFEKYEDSLTSKENPLAAYNTVNPFEPVYYDANGGKCDSLQMSGRLLGGCMDVLANIRGTKFDRVHAFCEKYKEDGILWFMESCELNPMTVRRTLWAMRNSGWFRYVKGFLVGRPMFCDKNDYGLSQEEAFVSAVRELGVPVAYGLDIGHLPPAMPIISGAVADVSCEQQSVRVDYRFQ